MNADGHLKRAHSIQQSLDKLLPDPEGINVASIVELTYGFMFHTIAFGMETKYNRHLDTHVGLPRELRKIGENEIADWFEEIDLFRAGRWYGSKGNGEVVKKCLELARKIKLWATAK